MKESTRQAVAALITALLILFVLAGCKLAKDTDVSQYKPTNFDKVAEKTREHMERIAAGVTVTGERIAAGDLEGARKANDVTGAGLPPAKPKDLEWFRKLCEPQTDHLALINAKAELNKALTDIIVLKEKVAAGLTPEEAQALADKAAAAAETRSTLKGAAAFAFAFAVINGVAGGYFLPRKKLVVAVSLLLALIGFTFLVLLKFINHAAFDALFWTAACVGGVLLVSGGALVLRWMHGARAQTSLATGAQASSH